MVWFTSPIARRPLLRGLIALVLATLLPPQIALASAPPAPPGIVSPATSNVLPDAVHMELTVPFRDPDGDAHQATDWEIRTSDGATVVWAAHSSPQLVHAHLVDGAFLVRADGQPRLAYRSPYLFRVRVQDSSGDWSTWSEREFLTARPDRMPAWQVDGIVSQPAPVWRTDGDAPVVLPAGASLAVETEDGQPLLTLTGDGHRLSARLDATSRELTEVRLHLRGPAESWLRLPNSQLTVVSSHAERRTIYLPAIRLGPDAEQVLWVSEAGATYFGSPEQTDFDRTVLARDTPLPWALEPGYRLEAAVAALQMPTTLAFVPDPGHESGAPRYYVSELHGRIKVVTNGGRIGNFAEDLLNFDPVRDLAGDWETGVAGLCLAPTGHDLYITATFRDAAGGLRNKLMRLRSSDGLTATAAEDLLVIDGDQGSARTSHQIQQCSFGPDGKLYVFVADGPDPAAAQNDQTFNGKVLRLNPDGSAPPDNPAYDPANPTAPISYLYTMGQRNAYGMTWRPSTGQLYLTENGPAVDRLVHVVPGRNYGWDGTDESMRTHAIYNWPLPHFGPAGLAFVEGPAAGAFPADKQGALLVAGAGGAYAAGMERMGKAIQVFRLRGDDAVAAEPTTFGRYIGEGRGTVVDLKLQPDGLYFTDLHQDDSEGGPAGPGGKIWRIRYTGQAVITASATSGPAPLTVTFTDSSTVVGATGRAWQFGDGQASTVANPTHTFTAPGRYVVALTVRGHDGQPVEALTLITVTDAAGQAPEPAATAASLPATPSPTVIAFPDTGVRLGGGFKQFWERHGGLAQFGYPITQEFTERSSTDGRDYTVQYFERARFEYHPEHKGTPGEVQLGHLGRQATAGREHEIPFQPLTPAQLASATAAGALSFDATGHTLSGVLRTRWEEGGGITIYGLPISEPFQEVSATNGETYLVQYFERARMELHPEHAGRVEEIRLARLGTLLAARLPGRS